ncbi:MAG: hypothetical protein AB7O49_06465 [Sphingomonadales bacterium]
MLAVEEEWMGRRGAAARFGVAFRTAARWVSNYWAKGTLERGKMGNPSPPKLTAHRETALSLLEANPDCTIEWLRHDLAERASWLVTAWFSALVSSPPCAPAADTSAAPALP